MLTKPELFQIPDKRSASHAVDVWQHNLTSYVEISTMLGILTTRELMSDRDDLYKSVPTEAAKKRAGQALLARWQYHRCQVMALDAIQEAFSLFTDRAKACGLQQETARQFLTSYVQQSFIPQEMYDPPPKRLARKRS